MKVKFITFVRYFFVLLFVYAAISKLTTFEAFQVQLAQSPLLSAFASSISYSILILELFIAVLLCIKRSSLLGLYLSFGLMLSFTIYIYLILNFSDFIPCSCGGILEKLGWTEHLWFNIACVLLALIALVLQASSTPYHRFLYSKIAFTFIFSTGIVVVLFMQSEHIIKKENPFVRRYIPHGVSEDQTLDLGVNSFYFAGTHQNTLYLGNHTAPLRMAVVDSTFSTRKNYTLSIDQRDLPFQSIKLKVLYPYFYLADGYVPVIFRGKLNQLKAETLSLGEAFFSDYQPIDSTKIAFSGQQSSTKENVLGLLTPSSKEKVSLHPELLEKQIDGVFDTDGILSYSPHEKKVVYTYFYRNQFIVADTNLNLLYRGNTIDTTSRAQIKITKLKNGEHKMSAPPHTINKNVVIHRNLLFNISNSIGQLESKSMWKQAVIVDVYNYEKQAYIGSFYVHHRGEHKLTSMLVTDHYLYGLFDTQLVRYRLAGSIINKYNQSGESQKPVKE